MSDYDGLHLCENCHDAYTLGRLCSRCADQEMIDGSLPPPMTAEEARIENIEAIVESAVLNAQGLVSGITDLMDLSVGNRAALLMLRGALNDFLDEYDPDMDDGRSMEDLS